MTGSNYSSSMSFFLRTIVLLLFSISNIVSNFASLTPDLCHPDQRDVLLQLKTEFKILKPGEFYDLFGDPMNVTSYPKTESWGNSSTDCCNWDGVTCDTESGKVIGVDLSCSCLYGPFQPNSSLFRLKHLTSLNLAYNNFTLSPIPAKFNNLMLLKTLNLSMSSLKGHIPHEILHLTNLVSLDLSFCYALSIENSPLFLRLLARNLRNLRALDMSFLNISSEIPHEFSYMSSLRFLSLTSCYLVGEFPSSVFLIPNLESIILDYNQNLRGKLPVFRRNNSLHVLSISDSSFSGIIPESIGNLKHLVSLRLAESNFSGRIPSSLGELSNLSSLDLSSNHFTGEVPFSIGKLSNLSSLDLSSNHFTGEVPSSLGELSNLSSLDLSSNHFTGEVPSSIGELFNLSSLHLFGNHFTGEVPSSIGNLKQLIDFDVGNNQLTGNFPSALLNLTKLRLIYLSANQFTGSLPPNIGQLSKLESLYASGNYFTGAVPSSLYQISSLREIYLEDNQLSDLVGFQNISLLSNLQYLSLHSNSFRVSSPVDFNVFSSLKQLEILYLSGIPISTSNITSDSDFSSNFLYLSLSGCNITEFPEFIKNLKNLHSLNISKNSIKGQVPYWLWSLQELAELDLSHNSFSGFDGSLKAVPGSKIRTLDLRSNAFQGKIFIPSTSIAFLFASSNHFTGEIPISLCSGQFSPTIIIDLSNNHFHGSIPRCLGNDISSLEDLNLGNNSLSGSIPDMFMHAYQLESIDVRHNRLEGKLPLSLTNCSALEVLNVESNKISGTFPFHLSSLQKLQVLVLRSNKFHGMLYQSDGAWFGFPQLKIIDVSHNDFFGSLPSDYFLNWTAISSNEDKDTQARYIGDSRNRGYYTSIVLMNKGVSMEMERILTIYTAIDFSGNRIHGQVPESIGLLKELHILNLSRNAITGRIPPSLANVTALESLDLSQNKLFGEIPPKLGDLFFLEWINVSHNQLQGSIPQGTQFQRQKCSSYEGNPKLYGPSLKDICGEPTPPESEMPVPSEEEEEAENESLSWMAAGLGFAPGIVFGFTMGHILFAYKQEWFIKTFGRNKKRVTR